jgi:hypothetical protein
VGWKKKRAALVQADSDRRNLAMRRAAVVKLAEFLGHVSGISQHGSEGKRSLSHSSGQRVAARAALAQWPDFRHHIELYRRSQRRHKPLAHLKVMPMGA